MADALVDEFHKPGRIKINVGQGGKHGLTGEMIDPAVLDTDLAALVGHLGQALDGVDQYILQFSHIRLLAADTNFCAAFAFCGLFTLKTEHGMPPFLG
jgi:hypothetical protein